MCVGARIVESCVVKLTAGVCVQCVGVNEGPPQASALRRAGRCNATLSAGPY